MAHKDNTISYYDILGVRINASPESLQAAFHQMAKKLHPDAGGSAEEMTLLNKAYEVLSDTDQRAIYDKSLEKKVTPVKTNQPTIDQYKNQERALVMKVRKDAGKTFVFGMTLLIAGLFITDTTYASTTLRGAYIFAAGPIIIGLIMFINGLFRILSPYTELRRMFSSKSYKHKFLLEKPRQSLKAVIIIGLCVITVVLVIRVIIGHARLTN